MTNKEIEYLKEIIIDRLKKELPSFYQYHSAEHTLRVMEKAELIANDQKVGKQELKLIKIAALFHDTGFIKTGENHEELSCDIAKSYLVNYKMKVGEIDKICGMILATKIPQTPQNHLEEILADADLEYLGTEDFERISGYLFNELKHLNPSLTNKKWFEIQINFIESHSYFTAFGKKYLSEIKNKHLIELKEKYQKTFT